MRGPVLDVRLEVLPGLVEDIRATRTGSSIAVDNLGYLRTGVACGLYEPRSNEGNAWLLNGTTPVIGPDPGEWGDEGSGIRGRSGDVWWVSRAFGSGTVFASWLGVGRALTFDRVLGDSEVERIAARVCALLEAEREREREPLSATGSHLAAGPSVWVLCA